MRIGFRQTMRGSMRQGLRSSLRDRRAEADGQGAPTPSVQPFSASGAPPDATIGGPYAYSFVQTGHGSISPADAALLAAYGFTYNGATGALSAASVGP